MNKLVELLRDLLLVLIGEGAKDLEKFDILMAGLFLYCNISRYQNNQNRKKPNFQLIKVSKPISPKLNPLSFSNEYSLCSLSK